MEGREVSAIYEPYSPNVIPISVASSAELATLPPAAMPDGAVIYVRAPGALGAFWVLVRDYPGPASPTAIAAQGGGYWLEHSPPGGGVGGTGLPGQVAFWSAVAAIAGDNDLWWDNTNKRLGIGTTTPTTKVEIANGQELGLTNGTRSIVWFQGGSDPVVDFTNSDNGWNIWFGGVLKAFLTNTGNLRIGAPLPFPDISPYRLHADPGAEGSFFDTGLRFRATTIDATDSPFTATADHYVIFCDTSAGPIEITLDPALENGRSFVVKDATGDAATNPITVTNTIDGVGPYTIDLAFGSLVAVRNATDYTAIVAPQAPAAGGGVLTWGATDTTIGALTRYLWPGFQLANTDLADNVRVPMPAGRWGNLRVRCATAGTGTAPAVCTVLKNGAASAVTCSLASGVATGSDLSNSETFNGTTDVASVSWGQSGVPATGYLGVVATLERLP